MVTRIHNCASIASVPKEADRIFWSVMIPTYNPKAEYLSQALVSVLQQAPGPEQMQIEVVDDCSPGTDVAALVKSIAGERVENLLNAQDNHHYSEL